MNYLKSNLSRYRSALILILVLGSLIWLSSCKDEPFEYNLDRASAFSFKLDTFDLVTTNDVVFFTGPAVLHNFSDTQQVLYQRISLQAHGFTPSSTEYWFIVDFDTHLDGNAVGSYTSNYSFENGGIDNMRLIIANNGAMLEYQSIQQLNAVYFQVDAQRPEERIMKGTFGGFLYLNSDPANPVAVISDGVFKDIYY